MQVRFNQHKIRSNPHEVRFNPSEVIQDGQWHVKVKDWPKLSGVQFSLQVSMFNGRAMTAIFVISGNIWHPRLADIQDDQQHNSWYQRWPWKVPSTWNSIFTFSWFSKFSNVLFNLTSHEFNLSLYNYPHFRPKPTLNQYSKLLRVIKKNGTNTLLNCCTIPFVITIALFLVRNINVFKVHNISVCIPFVFLVLVVSDMSVSNNIPGSFNTYCTSYKQVFLGDSVWV